MEKLNNVKDTSMEVKQLEELAAAVMKAGRAEISATLTNMKKETQVEVEEKLAEGRKKVEAAPGGISEFGEAGGGA